MNTQINKEVDEDWDYLLSADLDLLDPPIQWVQCNVSEYQNAVGIHLIEPSSEERSMAYERAVANGFKTIYCHYSNVWQLRR